MKKILTLAAAAVITAGTVVAQEFPSKTIEVVTHAGNGGGTDVTTRMMMLRARRTLGTDMVVVNKKGGGGAVAMDHYLTVPADGHTILTFTIGHAATVAKGETKMKLSDVRPIARGTDDPQILMVRCGAYSSADDFVAKQKAEGITYGTTHLGNIDDVSAFMFTKKGGMQMPKILPFDGGGELATQLVAGAVDAAVLNLAEAGSQIEAGDVCPMVILDRNPMAPIPKAKTSIEMGIDLELATVRGYATHAGVDKARRDELEAGMMKAMNHSLYQAYLANSGLNETSPMGAAEWGKQMKMMVNEFGPALKEMGLVK